MAVINLKKMSAKELTALQSDIAKAIKDAEAKERKEALAAVTAVAAERGFTLEELVSPKPRAKKSASIKYRDPKNPENTWSGRGRQPAWFKEAILAGADPDDLEI